jgi:hypothetical protein
LKLTAASSPGLGFQFFQKKFAMDLKLYDEFGNYVGAESEEAKEIGR